MTATAKPAQNVIDKAVQLPDGDGVQKAVIARQMLLGA